jgi:hypothetical protein
MKKHARKRRCKGECPDSRPSRKRSGTAGTSTEDCKMLDSCWFMLKLMCERRRPTTVSKEICYSVKRGPRGMKATQAGAA